VFRFKIEQFRSEISDVVFCSEVDRADLRRVRVKRVGSFATVDPFLSNDWVFRKLVVMDVFATFFRQFPVVEADFYST
jgi:hypothetical protein